MNAVDEGKKILEENELTGEAAFKKFLERGKQ